MSLRALLLAVLVISPQLHADSLRGRLLEAGGRKPVPGALVQVQGLSASALSRGDGRFELDLEPGYHSLSVSVEDYETRAESLTKTAGPQDLPDIYLLRTGFTAEAVQVRGRREEAPVRQPISREEIRRLPGVGRDPLRALQTLPGVVSPSDFSGQLAVRGGGPQDNLYFLDEVPWPVPFHYGGALGSVHGDVLQSVDLYPAAFPARWGGVDGAILDAHSRDIKRDGVHGQLDVNFLWTEFLVEGPGPSSGRAAGAAKEDLSPPATSAGLSPTAQDATGTAKALSDTARKPGPLAPLDASKGYAVLAAAAIQAAPGAAEVPDSPPSNSAWLVSGRRSYLELVLPHISQVTAVPYFWDLSLLGRWEPGPQDRLRLTALASDDALGLNLTKDDVGSADFVGDFRYHSGFESAGLTWERRTLDGQSRNLLTPFIDKLAFNTSFGAGYGIDLTPVTAGLREDFRQTLGDHELGLGGSISQVYYDVFGFIFRRNNGQGSGTVTVSDPKGITLNARAQQTELFLQDRWAIAPWFRLTAGVHWQQDLQMASGATDPRASLEWDLGPRTRLSLGAGAYSGMPTPAQLAPDFGNPQLSPQRSWHWTAGLSQDIGPALQAKLEVYRKDLWSMVVNVPDDRLYSNDGEGYAQGAEATLRWRMEERFFGWISYARSQSWRRDNALLDWKLYQYDQPDNMTVVGSWAFSPHFSAGLKANWHSGALYTPVIGRLPSSGNFSGWAPVYGDPFSQRVDDYLRVDLRADYGLLLRGWRMNFYAEVINLLNRPNPAGVSYNKDYTQQQTVDNLPRLPYLGLGVEF